MWKRNPRAAACRAVTRPQLSPGGHLGRWLCFVIIACAACGAAAQRYPARPIRIIVPLAPGGGNDTMARLIAADLTHRTGQTVVVDNRPGGGSVIASELAMKADPDGYTLYLVSTSFAAAPNLHKRLSFDTLKDFTPITRLGTVPGGLITHASLPVNSVRDLIALARRRPGEITFGSAGIGTASHLGGELFNLLTGVHLTHVPYRGSALVTTALLAGEVMVAFTNPVSALPHVKAGRLKMLAVTSGERWPLFPGYPTIAESGVPGYELLIWNGMVAPAGTPPAIIARLHALLVQAVESAEVKQQLAREGSLPQPQSPEAFGAFIRSQIESIGKIVRAAHVPVN
jgi:tripartite-type tricarboxylate transporter receptor subunit TctC